MRTKSRQPERGLFDRLLHYKKEIAGAAALAIAAAGMGMALKMNSDANHERHEKEQTALELVIKPQMQQIASETLELAKEHPDEFDIESIGEGMVQIKADEWGEYSNHLGIEVVVRADASGNPNTSDPLFVGIESSATPKSGPGYIRQAAYTAPGGEKFANAEGYRYGQVADGWSALYSSIKTSGPHVVIGLSGTIDTAEQRQFSVDDQGNVTNALVTAESIVPFANDLCTSVTSQLVN